MRQEGLPFPYFCRIRKFKADFLADLVLLVDCYISSARRQPNVGDLTDQWPLVLI